MCNVISLICMLFICYFHIPNGFQQLTLMLKCLYKTKISCATVQVNKGLLHGFCFFLDDYMVNAMHSITVHSCLLIQRLPLLSKRLLRITSCCRVYADQWNLLHEVCILDHQEAHNICIWSTNLANWSD